MSEKCVWVSCLTLWDPMDHSLPGSSIHGCFQARMLEWVAISYSRGSSRPRDWSRGCCISCIGRRILYHRAMWKALYCRKYSTNAHLSRNFFSTYVKYSPIKKKKTCSLFSLFHSIDFHHFFHLCCEECYVPESDIKHFGYISEIRWYPHIYKYVFHRSSSLKAVSVLNSSFDSVTVIADFLPLSQRLSVSSKIPSTSAIIIFFFLM